MYYIGLDLGTSSLKGLLVSSDGKILREAHAGYQMLYPKSGWSEQDPADWLNATHAVLAKLTNGVKKQIAGISVSGQMHGLVLLDEHDEVIRPAILWNDGRAKKETDFLNETIGREKLAGFTANIAFAGFTAPKILWVKEHEPENFARIKKICLPKDYLSYKLTGVFSTDYSDASGMLFLDVRHRQWSKEMLEICSVKEDWLPKLFESCEKTGKVNCLPNAVMAAGAGDNPASAVGAGILKEGDCNIALGTSGAVFIAIDRFSMDKNNALHSFCHANGKWCLMGCILSAASCNAWWLERILRTKDYDGATEGAVLGKNGVFFLPYLMGERCPHNDVNARGAFLGLCADTTRSEMSLAVLEGVAFALRDCVECAREQGITIQKATVCGGGAKSAVWKRILANVLNVKIFSSETEQNSAYGAAILAMVCCGEYEDVNAAARALVTLKECAHPEPDLVNAYEERYQTYRKFYPALKGLLKN